MRYPTVLLQFNLRLISQFFSFNKYLKNKVWLSNIHTIVFQR